MAARLYQSKFRSARRARKSLPKVALLIDTSLASGRDILRGVGRYVRDHHRWALLHEPLALDESLKDWLREWQGDGIIARPRTPEHVALLQETRLPVVDVLGEVDGSAVPLVHVDDRGVGDAAAAHLLERGFASFGFFGLAGRKWSVRRRDGFKEALAKAGFGSAVYEQSREYRQRVGWEFREDSLAHWIRGLRKPAGVMVCSDQVGLDFLEACRHAGFTVPDEVAVVGVDNDEAYCEIAMPSLSSVWPSHLQVGYQAAALLERLMAGEPPPEAPIFVPPGGVKTRQSSDVLAIDDRQLARAINLIREHACAGISVDEVAEGAALSRTVLQRRFKKVLGKTVYEEILGVRIKRACRLLAETDFPLLEIAEQAGFKYQEYMGAVFRSRLDKTPAEYRKLAKQSASVAAV